MGRIVVGIISISGDDLQVYKGLLPFKDSIDAVHIAANARGI